MERTAATAATATSESIIPDDVVYNILLQLPAQQLIGLKTVSKSWLAIISNPNFILQHHQRNRSVKAMQRRRSDVAPDEVIAHLNMYTHLIKRIPRSIMIPLSTFSYSSSICTVDGSKVKIWDWVEKEGRSVHMCMPEFDPDHADQYSILGIGFGYGCLRSHDGELHDRKLVVLIRVLVVENRRHDNRCYVYSFRTRSWRSVQLPAYNCDVGGFGSSTENDGVIYWLVDNDAYLLTFDLRTEAFGRIRLHNPMPNNGYHDCSILMKTGNQRLHIVTKSYNPATRRYIIKYPWLSNMYNVYMFNFAALWRTWTPYIGFLWNVGKIVWDEDEDGDEDLYAVWKVNGSHYRCRLGLENKTSNHQQIRGTFLV